MLLSTKKMFALFEKWAYTYNRTYIYMPKGTKGVFNGKIRNQKVKSRLLF